MKTGNNRLISGVNSMCKLMIVEDEPMIRAGLKEYFDWKALGVHTIVEAENGREGVDRALVELPDLVITDIRMPIMDGLEMIAQLRTQLPETLFIILSGHNEFEYAQKAIHYGGVYHYLLKPLQYETSFSVITNCIEKIKGNQLMRKNDKHPEKSLTDKPDEVEPDPDIQLFTKIEAYIKKHIDGDLTLNQVADHFFYNPSYLSRLFKTKLNKNYMSFVTEIRIDYAKQYLHIPQYAVADISKMCGYKSYKHFVKVFKDVTQMTPTEYRKQLRE